MNWLQKLFRIRERSDGDVVKPFLDHLEDLRWTLIKMVVVLLAAMIFAFTFHRDLVELLEKPLHALGPNASKTLMVTGVTDPFMISLSLSFYGGIVLSLPFQLYFLASFVLPALTRQEKKYLIPGIAGGFVLFGIGVVACFHYILPQTLRFFWDYGAGNFNMMWQAREYFSFVTQLCIAFGLLSELPVVMLVLALFGFVSFKLLNNTRAYAIVIIMMLAAFVAPTPDPLTFLSMAAPVIILYEICIWLIWLLERRRSRIAAAQTEL
ncbi:MAG TPA: twin-arginine translocase subunit TatC [Chthoniobacteraceae bacterium]|jgi:sec-independent protein translocase protein TatC